MPKSEPVKKKRKPEPQEVKPRLLTIRGTENYLGLKKSRIYELLGAKQLVAKKCGGRTLVTMESVDAFADSLPDAHLTTATQS
jgi:hypothetical protein